MKVQINPRALSCPRCGKALPEIEGDGVIECRGAKCGKRLAIVWMPVDRPRFHSMTEAERSAINRKKWKG